MTEDRPGNSGILVAVLALVALMLVGGLGVVGYGIFRQRQLERQMIQHAEIRAIEMAEYEAIRQREMEQEAKED